MPVGAARASVSFLVLAAALGSSLGLAAGCADDAATGTGGSTGADTGAGGSPDDDDDDDDDDDGDGAGGATQGATTTATSSTGAGGGGSCPSLPTCDTPLPDLGPARDWGHSSSSAIASGFQTHRGRDQIVNPGDPVWIMGKLAYGITDKDLKDEEVDIWMLRDCGSTWEKIATTWTTEEGAHETVEGVEDTGGWVYFQLPQILGLGRHRFELVVAGDLTHTSVLVDVVDPGTPYVVTDVDGTLTTSETEEFNALLQGEVSPANADAPAVLGGLAAKGYRIYYLSARPEFLVDRTRDFVREHGFPPGLVRTTLNTTGATGAEAAAYKMAELAALAEDGILPGWAFGNTATDAEAFFNAGIQPGSQRIMYLFEDQTYQCRTIPSYTSLLPEIGALPLVCL
jgi:hypothetical protein